MRRRAREVGEEKIEALDQEAEGDHGDAGADPGEERPLVRRMVPEVPDGHVSRRSAHSRAGIIHADRR